MRLGDLDALKDIAYINKGNFNTVEGIREWVDNAPTVEPKKEIVPVCKVTFDKEQLQEIVDKKVAELVADNKRPQGEWIPVSERLPKHANQAYLVTVDYGRGSVCSCQRFFYGEELGWNDDCVIAWQPLPEPYKKGGAE